MRPEFIKIGDTRIRLKDISDYGVNYYRREERIKERREFDTVWREVFFVAVPCLREECDFGVLFVKTYRKRPLFFSSNEWIYLANDTNWGGSLSSQEGIDIEATLKKLDEYLC